MTVPECDDCAYQAIQIGSDWYASTDYETHQTSLTKAQSVVDPDGMLRYVISERNPGHRQLAGDHRPPHRPDHAALAAARARPRRRDDGPTVEVVPFDDVPTRAAALHAPDRPPRSTPSGSPPGSAPWPGGCCRDRTRCSQDKVVVLSGVGPGLGRALGEEAARMGADLVLVSRTERRLEKMAEVVRSHGRRALVVPTDITDEDARKRLVEAALDGVRPGRLPDQQRVRHPADGPAHHARPAGAARRQRDQRVRAAAALRAVRRRAGRVAERLGDHAQLVRRLQLAAGVRRLQAVQGRAGRTSPRRWRPSSGRAGSGSTASRRRTSTRTSTRPTSTGSPRSRASPTRTSTARRPSPPTSSGWRRPTRSRRRRCSSPPTSPAR